MSIADSQQTPQEPVELSRSFQECVLHPVTSSIALAECHEPPSATSRPLTDSGRFEVGRGPSPGGVMSQFQPLTPSPAVDSVAGAAGLVAQAAGARGFSVSAPCSTFDRHGGRARAVRRKTLLLFGLQTGPVSGFGCFPDRAVSWIPLHACPRNTSISSAVVRPTARPT